MSGLAPVSGAIGTRLRSACASSAASSSRVCTLSIFEGPSIGRCVRGWVAPSHGNSITCSSMTGQEYDVVVVGSGGAGMVAALTAAHQGLSAVVVEKAPHYGGSTARSGGGVWIPNNEILKRDGVSDTPEAARTYLHGIIGDVVDPKRIDTYLDRAPEMLSFVLKHTPLKMCWVPGYSDYYPEAPGGRPRGRSIEPKPFNARKLGPDEAGLEPAYGKLPLNVVVMQQDYVRLNMLKRHPRGVLRSLKVGVRTMWAKSTGKNLVGMGRALIAPLRVGLQQVGVPVQ